MIIFDYIYLFAKKQYLKWGEKDIPGIYGISIITLLIFSNIFTIDLLLLIVRITQRSYIDRNAVIITMSGIYLLSFFYLVRYKKLNKANPEEKLAALGKNTKLYTLLYILITISTLIFTMLFYRIHLNNYGQLSY
jgi:hypothetical protein